MPTVHLICGSIGAGKTTYAKALAKRIGCVLFSTDDWMSNLFVAEPGEQVSLKWAVDRTARCEKQIWAVAEQLLALGSDVVFDVGLSTRDHRDRFRTHAAQLMVDSKLHYLDVDVSSRFERVRQRNAARSGAFAFDVTDAMFQFMENAFEPPSDDELYDAMILAF